ARGEGRPVKGRLSDTVCRVPRAQARSPCRSSLAPAEAWPSRRQSYTGTSAWSAITASTGISAAVRILRPRPLSEGLKQRLLSHRTAQADAQLGQTFGILESAEPGRVLSHATRPRLVASACAKVQDRRFGAARAARTRRERPAPEIPISLAGKGGVPASNSTG